MRYHGLFGLMLVGLVGSAIPGAAADEPARPETGGHRLETRATRVALFKNGLGFFVREGKLPAAATVKLGPFAAPSHGTFWVSYPQKVKLDSLVAHEVTVTQEAPAITLVELLRANVGREVVVVPDVPGGEPVKGRLLAVPDDRQQPPVDPYAWGLGPGPIPPYDARNPQGRVALIQTPDGVVAIDPYTLRQATILGDEAASTIERITKAWEIEAHLAKPAPGATLTASYLAKGITWAPSYVVDMSDPDRARITAKAEVINEAEDLADVHLDLTTGFPNLRFADIVSPIAGKDTVAGFLAALARGASERGRPGAVAVMAQSGAYRYDVYGGAAAEDRLAVPEYGAAAAGAVVEDFFLYPLEHVTLAKRETGYYPLFTASVPYTQIHKWEIPDYVTQEDRYGEPRREQREMQEEVWHCLKLTNDTKIPWTTAPAQTVKAGNLLGQDTLDYTSPTATSTLRITRAMAVKAEQAEYEVERKRDAAQFYGYSYDLLTVNGRLRVKNHKDEAVTLEIAKTLSGEVKESAPQAKVERLARGLARMNPTNVLTWSFTLQPGEDNEITYTYQVLIRR